MRNAARTEPICRNRPSLQLVGSSFRSALELAPPLLAALLLLNACGGSQPASDAPAAGQAPMSASPAAEPVDASSAQDPSLQSLDQLAASFEQAERRLAELDLAELDSADSGSADSGSADSGSADSGSGDFGLERQDDKPDTKAGPKAGGVAREAELSKKKMADRRAERCTVACRALASMRRSAVGLCRMAGEDDPRCESVSRRAERARVAVARACPACASAEARQENEPKP